MPHKYRPHLNLLRHEVHPTIPEPYSSDVIIPVRHEDTNKLVLNDGSHSLLNLEYPYQGLALLDR